MSKIEDGGTAFPTELFEQPGMTLRDYFATAALQGVITKGTYSSVAMMSCGKSFDYERLAYIVADRMLAARKEAQP